MKFWMGFLIISACSQVNVESQKHYSQSDIVAHKIVVGKALPTPKTTEAIVNADLIDKGRDQYMRRCATCHGVDATGGDDGSVDTVGKPVNLRLLVRETPQFTLAIQYSKNRSTMPGWAQDLKDSDVKAIIEYLKTLN